MKKYDTIIKLIKIYALSISLFFIFRVILFLTEIDKLDDDVSFRNIIQAFIMGIRFDIVISGYILLLPALVLLICDIVNIKNKLIYKITFYWILILFSFAFLIAAADIPYFNQFFERFSIGAFEWINNIDFVFSMIIEEPKYFLILIPFISLEIVFYALLKKIFYKKTNTQRPALWKNITLSLLLLLAMFIGIRGRIEKKSPIRIGTAYFCDNAFLNKLGLNPVFTLVRSYLDSKDERNKTVNIVGKEFADEKIKEYLNIREIKYNSPIAREVKFDTIATSKPNIVVILMESMSAAKMKYFGNKNNITPFLDSLINYSMFFENFYSSGKHTFNGIFSTLFSFPALYRQHTMKKIRRYDGISSVLKNHGYSTTFFITHDSQFDNIEGFLRANDFETIISQADYPSSEVKTTLGVPDDYMFSYSIPIINKLAANKKPFFVTFMTASDHGPYYIPEYFEPKNKEIKQQIVEYADYSLKKFIDLASKQKWFDNTIFVFVADHGAALNVNYEIPLNYFHIPLIVYSPKNPVSKKIKDIGSQIDVFPTIMGILKLPYINNTLGIDLLREKRKYAIVNNDDKIGIIDTAWLCIMKDYGRQLELYHYSDKDKNNYYTQYSKKAQEMATYGKVNLQVTQSMILDKKTTLHNKKSR